MEQALIRRSGTQQYHVLVREVDAGKRARVIFDLIRQLQLPKTLINQD
jgi:hypothetical protein